MITFLITFSNAPDYFSDCHLYRESPKTLLYQYFSKYPIQLYIVSSLFLKKRIIIIFLTRPCRYVTIIISKKAIQSHRLNGLELTRKPQTHVY